MQLQPTFVDNIKEVYGQEGLIWIKKLPELIEELASVWNFIFIKSITNLSYSFVALVKRTTNDDYAILKMTPAGESIIAEINYLNCSQAMTPRIYQKDPSLHAFLMENITPGEPLKLLVKNGRDDEATRIICSMINKLKNQAGDNYQFTHLSELAKSLSILEGKFDKKMLSQAQSLFRDLSQDKTNDVLLHGDLHHDNIISSDSSWKAIDPHGYIGDPAAEAGVMIRNPMDAFPTSLPLAKTIERRLKILGEELPFDHQRIKGWTFCMTILSIAWTFEGQQKINELELAVAAAINESR